MIKLFKKVKNRHNSNQKAPLLGKYIDRQLVIAGEYLNGKTQYWNKASKLVALILFCLLFGIPCILLLVKAINHL